MPAAPRVHTLLLYGPRACSLTTDMATWPVSQLLCCASMLPRSWYANGAGLAVRLG